MLLIQIPFLRGALLAPSRAPRRSDRSADPCSSIHRRLQRRLSSCGAGADVELQEVGRAPEALTLAEQERLLTWGPYARQLLAVHPDTLRRILEHLVEDENPRVRADVANSPSAPESALQRLTRDSAWRVRAAIAENPSAPKELLEQLASDHDPFVQKAARRSLRR